MNGLSHHECDARFFINRFQDPNRSYKTTSPPTLICPFYNYYGFLLSLQYLTTILQRTPLVPLKLVVNLGGQFLWVDCDRNYVSSSYLPARCGSAQCSLARASSSCGDCYFASWPGCKNNTCSLFPFNPVTHSGTSGELASDVLSLKYTDGSNPGRLVSVSKFIFSCEPTALSDGLSGGAVGMAGPRSGFLHNSASLLSSASIGNSRYVCLLPPPPTAWRSSAAGRTGCSRRRRLSVTHLQAVIHQPRQHRQLLQYRRGLGGILHWNKA